MGNAAGIADGGGHLADTGRLGALLAGQGAGQPADEQLRLPIFQQAPEGLGRARHLGGRQHAHGACHPLAGIAHGHPHAHFPDIERHDAHG